jgi:hypothetical protein
MAWAIPAWKTYPVPSAVSTGAARRWKQVVVISLTATAADVDWDFGDGAAGTLFVSAIADGTHGAKATALAAHLAALTAKTTGLVKVSSDIIDNTYLRGAAVAAGVCTIAPGTSKAPDIAFNAADAPTAMKLEFEYDLLEAATPVAATSMGTI